MALPKLNINRTNRPLTVDKLKELIKLNPSWILFGFAEISVFYVDKKVVGVYRCADSDHMALFDALDSSGYTRYYGSLAANFRRGMVTIGKVNFLKKVGTCDRFRMTYTAKDGEVTVRTVRGWRYDEFRFTGFCEKANAERTFLFSGVMEVEPLP